MLKTLKKLVPNSLKKYYWRYLIKKDKALKKRVKFEGKSTKETFTLIHDINYWNGGESISGGGSDPLYTSVIIKQIALLLKELEIKSILDLPCGDFIWMQKVDLNNCDYIGADIVDELIISNNEKYFDKKNVEFRVLDLLKDELPISDIIINRDCLVHLAFNDIFKALKNIKKTKSKYLLTTTFTKETENKDITTGDWRRLNLELLPFNFPEPKQILNEGLTIEGNEDKSLALWLIEDIPDYG